MRQSWTLILLATAASLASVTASHSTPLTGPTCRDSDLFSNERWLHALHDSLSHCVDADPLARIHFCGTEHSLSMFAAEVARAPAEARFTVIIPLEHCGMHGDLIAGLLTDQRIANIFATTADGATVEVSQLPSPNLELLARDAFAGPPCAKLAGALERVFGSLEGALLEQDPSGMRLKRHYEVHMGARPGPDVSQQARCRRRADQRHDPELWAVPSFSVLLSAPQHHRLPAREHRPQMALLRAINARRLSNILTTIPPVRAPRRDNALCYAFLLTLAIPFVCMLADWYGCHLHSSVDPPRLLRH